MMCVEWLHCIDGNVDSGERATGRERKSLKVGTRPRAAASGRVETLADRADISIFKTPCVNGFVGSSCELRRDEKSKYLSQNIFSVYLPLIPGGNTLRNEILSIFWPLNCIFCRYFHCFVILPPLGLYQNINKKKSQITQILLTCSDEISLNTLVMRQKWTITAKNILEASFPKTQPQHRW